MELSLLGVMQCIQEYIQIKANSFSQKSNHVNKNPMETEPLNADFDDSSKESSIYENIQIKLNSTSQIRILKTYIRITWRLNQNPIIFQLKPDI